MVLDRYFEMVAEHGMQPFHRDPWINPRTGRVEPRVLGERPRMRWRVSVDEWDRLVEYAKTQYGSPAVGEAYLLGWPIAADTTLPSRSVIFESI